MKVASKEVKILATLLVPVAIIILLHQLITGFTIYNDGIGYYIYARSAVIDHDFDFNNELVHYHTTRSTFSNTTQGGEGVREAVTSPMTTPKGYQRNFYLIGNGLLWLPFFLAAHIFLLVLNAFTNAILANGFTWPYDLSIGAASIIYGFLGLVFSYKLCRRFFDRNVSILATIAIWYGTAVIWYHAVEPSMSHINAMFLGSAFTYLWYVTLNNRTLKAWFGLGLIGAMIYLVRQQEVILLILPLAELANKILKAGKKKFVSEVTRNLSGVLMFALGASILLAAQMAVWKALYGQFIVYTYTNITHGVWTFPPLIIPFLFSLKEGMIRIPALAIAIFGLILFSRKAKFTGTLFLIVLALQILITSSWTAWNNGYGLRFLVGLTPFFIIGMAEVMNRMTKGQRIILAATIILLNLINMVLFLLGDVLSKVPLLEIPGRIIGILV